MPKNTNATTTALAAPKYGAKNHIGQSRKPALNLRRGHINRQIKKMMNNGSKNIMTSNELPISRVESLCVILFSDNITPEALWLY